MIKLIASDLDGTIIDRNNLINADNLKAIKDINNKNVDFVICTGKTYNIVKDICSEFSANYGIFGNGNQIINLKTGEEIYSKLLSQDEINICLELAESHNLHVHLYSDNEVITEKLEFMDLRNYELQKKSFYSSSLKFKIVPNIKSYIKNTKMAIYKLIISSSANNLDKIKDIILASSDLSVSLINKTGKYKDLTINKEYQYLDISPSGVSKGNALNILNSYLKLSNSETMAVGDNLNDIDMIQNSGIGVAVANSYNELKDVAKYVTTNPVEKGGFAEAVYKFIDFNKI